jgi:hypothetical protein
MINKTNQPINDANMPFPALLQTSTSHIITMVPPCYSYFQGIDEISLCFEFLVALKVRS